MGDTHTPTHWPKMLSNKNTVPYIALVNGTHTHIHNNTKRGRYTQDTKTPNIYTKTNISDLLKWATYLLGGLKRPLHLQDFTSNVSQLKTNLSFHDRLMGHLSTQEHCTMCPHNIKFLSIMFTSHFCPSHSHHLPVTFTPSFCPYVLG